MATAKAKKYSKKRLPKGKRVATHPTEAVFRVDLATGKMRITDQKGDLLPEDEATPEIIEESGIDTENSPLLAVLFYAKCNVRAGGCVWKIVNGRRVLVW